MINNKTTQWMKALALPVLMLLMAAATPGYEVGDTVKDFRLKNVDGQFVSLANYPDAKGAIIIFDCNTCPFSKAYNDRIVALSKKYTSKEFPVIAINANDPGMSPGVSFEKMVQHAKKKGYSFPYLVDESQDVARAFGATNTPHVFVLEKNGNAWKVAYIGAIDNNARDAAAADKKYVEEAVDAILKGNTVSTTKTKAIGCGIKFRNS